MRKSFAATGTQPSGNCGYASAGIVGSVLEKVVDERQPIDAGRLRVYVDNRDTRTGERRRVSIPAAIKAGLALAAVDLAELGHCRARYAFGSGARIFWMVLPAT